MKTQRGITLISLTVYIIGMALVVGMISLMSTYFYTNMGSMTNTMDPVIEYTKFNSFFSEEVNHDNIKVLACQNNYIVFDNAVQYTFIEENKGIYRNKVKIVKQVESCTFQTKIQNGKTVIDIHLKIGQDEEKKTSYTLRK